MESYLFNICEYFEIAADWYATRSSGTVLSITFREALGVLLNAPLIKINRLIFHKSRIALAVLHKVRSLQPRPDGEWLLSASKNEVSRRKKSSYMEFNHSKDWGSNPRATNILNFLRIFLIAVGRPSAKNVKTSDCIFDM